MPLVDLSDVIPDAPRWQRLREERRTRPQTSVATRPELESPALASKADAIVQIGRSSIRLHSSQVLSTRVPKWARLLGGRPELPVGLEWPNVNGDPLAFIAQLDLARLPRVQGLATLPASGLLSFFFGPPPDDMIASEAMNESVVVYTAPEVPTRRARWPRGLRDADRFDAALLHPEVELTFPSPETPAVADLALSATERAAYVELCMIGGELANRVGGYPDWIQDSSLDIDEMLLLQVDSDGNAGMAWADGGRLYFRMPIDALERLELGSAWCEMQCC
jgi:hypothetical protein